MTFVSDAPSPLPDMSDNTPAPPAFQMTLIGQLQPVRIPERLCRSWRDDPAVVFGSSPNAFGAAVRVAGLGSVKCCRTGMARSGGEPALTVPAWDRSGTFVRASAQVRRHLEVG